MPNRYPIFAATLALLAATTACSRGHDTDSAAPSATGAKTDLAGLRDYSKVTVTGPDTVTISVGKPFAVAAQGDPRVLEQLEIKVVDGTLQIGRRKGWESLWTSGGNDRGATISVSMPALAGVALTGSGDVRADMAEGSDLKLELTGSGNLTIDAIKVATLDAGLTGSGNIALAGSADSARLSTTGSGDVEAEKLKAGKAEVSVMGSGGIALASDGAVAGSIMGSGDVAIRGKARCDVKAMGSGEADCKP